nr:hypothetical protein [uncultured bacterium]
MYSVDPVSRQNARAARAVPAGIRDRSEAPRKLRVGGPRTVRGQLQHRVRAGERLLPVRQVLAGALSLHQPAVPHGEVGELHRQLGERRRAPLRERGVQGDQLAQEHGERPAVVHEVVLHLEEEVFVVGEAQQAPADQRQGSQVEGRAELLGHVALHGGVALGLGQAAQVEAGEVQRAGLVDHLHRAAAHVVEGGAEDLVAADDLGQGALQYVGVQPAAEAEGRLEVVRLHPRRQLLEEPDGLLGEGERQRLVAGHGHQRRHLVPRPAGHIHQRGELRHGGRVEQGAHGKVHPEGAAQARHDLRRAQGVAAQVEEVLVDPHPLHAQHLGPDRRDGLLDRGARRGVLRALAGVRRVGRGESPAVDLAAGGQRELLQRHEGRGDHVLREPLAQVGAQLGGGRARPPAGRSTRPAARHPRHRRARRRRPRARRGAFPAPSRSRPAPPGSRAP